jgi:hypothetical protein
MKTFIFGLLALVFAGITANVGLLWDNQHNPIFFILIVITVMLSASYITLIFRHRYHLVLEEGKTYQRRDGRLVIVRRTSRVHPQIVTPKYPFVSRDGYQYHANGKSAANRKFDLMMIVD